MTIKEILPDLNNDQRIQLGNHIKGMPYIVTTGYKREDGNKVRTYTTTCHDLIAIEAAKLFINDNYKISPAWKEKYGINI